MEFAAYMGMTLSLINLFVLTLALFGFFDFRG